MLLDVSLPLNVVTPHIGDPDFADLAEEVAETQVVEVATIFDAAAHPAEDAELGIVLAS
ncbi:MAG: hypothetical protein Ct9H300mP1_29540 [Planctomycetaceae bacterium]|nr:MAG: hypothetical protein Ct9H300mP1_29540 [Planctomycetaceae bacterium]